MQAKQHRPIPLSRLLKIRKAVRQYGLVDLFKNLSLSPKAKFAIRLLFGKAKSNIHNRVASASVYAYKI